MAKSKELERPTFEEAVQSLRENFGEAVVTRYNEWLEYAKTTVGRNRSIEEYRLLGQLILDVEKVAEETGVMTAIARCEQARTETDTAQTSVCTNAKRLAERFTTKEQLAEWLADIHARARTNLRKREGKGARSSLKFGFNNWKIISGLSRKEQDQRVEEWIKDPVPFNERQAKEASRSTVQQPGDNDTPPRTTAKRRGRPRKTSLPDVPARESGVERMKKARNAVFAAAEECQFNRDDAFEADIDAIVRVIDIMAPRLVNRSALGEFESLWRNIAALLEVYASAVSSRETEAEEVLADAKKVLVAMKKYELSEIRDLAKLKI